MWAVEFEADAAKAFRKLDGTTQRAIRAKLTEIAKLSDPGAMAKPLMHDQKGRWRLRVGSWRVLFRMERQVLVIVVVDVGKRDAVYD
jgi:mRNA interferase RelE/StbE